jgi:hypothetical protein
MLFWDKFEQWDFPLTIEVGSLIQRQHGRINLLVIHDPNDENPYKLLDINTSQIYASYRSLEILSNSENRYNKKIYNNSQLGLERLN